MRISLIFPSFFSFLLFSLAQAAISPKKIDHLLRPKKSSISFAKAFVHIHKNLRNGHLKLKDARYFKRLSKNEKLFNIYSEASLISNIISKKNGIDSLAKICHDINIGQHFFANLLLERAQSYCIKRLLFNIVKRSTYKTLSKNTKDFFIKNIDQILQKRPRQLISILKKIPPKHLDLLFFKDNIIDSAIENDLSPNYKIMNIIGSSHNYTRHLQDSKYLIVKGIPVFRNEIKIMARDIIENIESEYSISNEKIDNLKAFIQANKKYISKKSSVKTISHIIKKLFREGYFANARDLIDFSLNTLSQKNKSKLIFLKLWSFILENRFDRVILEARYLGLFKNFSDLNFKTQFWLSRSLLNNNEKLKAKKYYEKILNKNPFNFYAIMSYHDLRKIDENTDIEIIKKKNDYRLKDLQDIIKTPSLKRLIMIYQCFHASKSYYMKEKTLNLILDSANIADDSHSEFYYLISQLLNNKGEFLQSFKVLNHALKSGHLESDKHTLKTLFPKPFMKEIKSYSRDDVDPYLILSVVRQESAFNPKAKSVVGARGLMQLMPRTARSLATIKRVKKLENPRFNLKLGIKYFNRLLKKFDGNLLYTLVAYNAGQGNLRKWTKKILRHDNILINIESIPFNETRNYVKYIYRNYFFYNFISGKKEMLTEELGETFALNLKN